MSTTTGSFCTATLIGCETVLTAAHCLCSDQANNAAECLRSGFPDPAMVGFFFQHVGFIVARNLSIHPQYDSPTSSADIAVVKLAGPVSGVVPAQVSAASKPAEGTAATVVGFGRITGGLFPPGVGIKRVASVVTSGCPTSISDDIHVCSAASGPTDGGVCQGDSGGPLLVASESGPIIAAVSEGIDGPAGPVLTCGTGVTDYYTDVLPYRSFIEDQAGADLGTAACGDLPPVGSAHTTVLTFDGGVSSAAPELRGVVDVPANTLLLRITMNGVLATEAGRNNVDLFVKSGTEPTTTDFECADTRGSAVGTCEIEKPSPGPWHTLAQHVAGTGEVQLTAVLFGGAATPTPTITPTPRSTPTPGVCVGDCDGSGTVEINELIVCVRIALGEVPLSTCRGCDPSGNGSVEINELVEAVNSALRPCVAP